MKILQKYVGREILLPFAICSGVLSFIFMAGYLVRAADFIIGRHVPLFDTLYLLMLAMPEMMSYTIPTSLLTAVMIVFGHLSQHNELRAMKASGIHLIHVVAPALGLGLLVSVLMLVFNDQVAGQASFELRRATKKMLIKYPKAMLQPGRFVTLNDNITFMAKEINGDELNDIIAYEVENTEKPVRTILADRGEIKTSPDGSEMRVRLFDGSISDAESEGVNTIQFQTYEFPPVDSSELRNMRKKQRDLTLAELLAAVSRGGAALPAEDKLRLMIAFHNRISFALGGFLFVLVGVPLAILVRRGEIVVSLALSMAAVGIYYILSAAANALAMHEALPPAMALWIPNLILVVTGGWLLRRAVAS